MIIIISPPLRKGIPSSRSKRRSSIPISFFFYDDNLHTLYRDVLTTLQTTRPLFSSYLRIRSLATSPSNPELQQARSELQSMLPDLTADLRDLVETVRVIEHDPYR